MNITATTTSNVPDIARHMAQVDKRFMHWYGGALRKSIRRRIRTGAKSSKPGKSPRRWAGDGGLRLVQYDVSRNAQSVTVGVIKYNGKQAAAKAVPGLLERGGTATRKFFFLVKYEAVRPRVLQWVPRGVAKRRISLIYHRKAKPRRVRYKPRPFVQPAFEKMNVGLVERYARRMRGAGL
jgi:hypothetical protein